GTAGERFTLLSGEDPSALGFCAQGGAGVISVTANVAPEAMANMVAAITEGRVEDARAIDATLAPLHRAMFVSPSPGPAKYALSRLGLCQPDVRLPILPPDQAAKTVIDDALRTAGLVD
ncbi:MAG: dihydrodipicolinate synthase family protein, partial [Pseudomonadota bacterium]